MNDTVAIAIHAAWSVTPWDQTSEADKEDDRRCARFALAEVWEAVNCLGGSAYQNNSYDQGAVDAIGKALEAIEELGGAGRHTLTPAVAEAE